MKKTSIILFILIVLTSCVGSSTSGVFGSGVSVALDPRTLGTQIDDSIMQKNLQARLALTEKKYLVKISVKVLDGRIFLGGKVDEPEEKLKITKMENFMDHHWKEVLLNKITVTPHGTKLAKKT